jgi:hypothetical protein
MKGKVWYVGYIIADSDGRAQDTTLRSNRRDSWGAFLRSQNSRKNRERWKRRGFRCVFVVTAESVNSIDTRE